MSYTETKDLFVVSDIHGHASELFAALDEAGFDSKNSRHVLVSCGDHFDRGSESRAVLRYLRTLKNKILLRGNHEVILENILARGFLRPIDRRNGVEKTVTAFFGRNCMDSDGRLYVDPRDRRDILDFLDSTYDYFETEHYVFAHGWLPLEQDEDGYSTLPANWRQATREAWRAAAWIKWYEAYRAGGLLPSGKTLVCGHRTAAYGVDFDPSRSTTDSSIFYGDRMIAIDACTAVSRRVNVLVLRDEPLRVPVRHEMKLACEPFDAILRGEKRVEMRLWDEKRQAVRPHDRIVFTCDGEHCEVRVLGVHVYPDFASLVDEFDPDELGFPALSRNAICAYLKLFYTDDQITRHGTVALRLART